jgi:hypothetical protein
MNDIIAEAALTIQEMGAYVRSLAKHPCETGPKLALSYLEDVALYSADVAVALKDDDLSAAQSALERLQSRVKVASILARF